MARIETFGDATLYLGDCLEIMPELGLVDMVLTSPPYGGIRSYGGQSKSDITQSIKLICEKLCAGGVIVWNEADQVINGSESGESFRHALYFMECGLRLHDTMIYCKECVTFPDANRYHPAHEYMFVFSNRAPRHFNGIKDWKNKWAGTSKASTWREQDGSMQKKGPDNHVVYKYGLRRNWWVMANAYNGETAGHPAPMPMQMAYDHIFTWTAQEETVLDPFMGSGTTGVACMNLGRKFIGIEIEEKYFDIACRRIDLSARQGRLAIGAD